MAVLAGKEYASAGQRRVRSIRSLFVHHLSETVAFVSVCIKICMKQKSVLGLTNGNPGRKRSVLRCVKGEELVRSSVLTLLIKYKRLMWKRMTHGYRSDGRVLYMPWIMNPALEEILLRVLS